jgi:Pyruvate/2-oxoacid:ferredoxin oxidoreductase gamma subunit
MGALHNDWFERYYPLIVPGGVLVHDAGKLPDALLARTDIDHVAVPVAALADDAGDPRAGNMVMTGVVAGLTGLASRDALATGMAEVVPAHRADRIARNLHAVELGFQWVERERPQTFAAMRLA